jgi:hypothetical protein
MFANRLLKSALPKLAVKPSGSRGIHDFLQKNVWRKSTVMYITYVVVGAIAVECVYGSVTNYIWESNNQGVSSIFVSV